MQGIIDMLLLFFIVSGGVNNLCPAMTVQAMLPCPCAHALHVLFSVVYEYLLRAFVLEWLNAFSHVECIFSCSCSKTGLFAEAEIL